MGWPQNISTCQRVTCAKHRIEKVIVHVGHVIDLHESNRIVLYSPVLSDQIPKSRAAHCFNLFRGSVFRYQIIRLCALWDRSADNAESIPSVVALVDNDEVTAALRKRIYENWLEIQPMQVTGLDGEETIQSIFPARAGRLADKAIDKLKIAINNAKNLEGSNEMISIRNFRDKHLAHALESTKRERTNTIELPCHGAEEKILKQSAEIVTDLLLGISNITHNWEVQTTHSESRAKELWSSCRFELGT